MPALWESSQRPMFVRTVWVDGVRHAILTKDDPLLQLSRPRRRRRPVSSVSYAGPATRDPALLTLAHFKRSRLSHAGDQLEQSFSKLRLVIDNCAPATLNSDLQRSASQATDTTIEKLDLGDIESVSDEGLVLKASAQTLYEFETSRSKFTSLCVEMRPQKPAKLNQKETREKCDLSDRVLQWLDLAGKIDLLTPDADSARITQQRHSCPEIQKRIPHQIFARSTPEPAKAKVEPKFESKIEDSAKVKRDVVVDIDSAAPRHAIESYARQSRHAGEKDTSARHAAEQSARSRVAAHRKMAPAGDSRSAVRKSVSAMKTESFFSQMDANLETRRKVVSEIYDVERQYAELVNRSLVPDACGRHIKRQLHIFMPPVPKKPVSAATNRSDSLLSQA